MSRLKLFRVDVDYIRYLYGFDKKVQYNEKESEDYTIKRPYIGVIFKIEECNYFVPLESPKPQHIKLKSNVHIMKINAGKHGLIAFGNMIPINLSQLINFDIDKESAPYKSLLQKQFIFCNKHSEDIKKHAVYTYNEVVVKKSKFFKKVCCDFKLLEEKCKLYK